MDDGLQFLKIHLNTAITGQKDHIAASVVLTCLPGADRCWKIVTHGRDCGIGDKTLALLDDVAMAPATQAEPFPTTVIWFSFSLVLK